MRRLPRRPFPLPLPPAPLEIARVLFRPCLTFATRVKISMRQLRSVANLSQLIAGFSMTIMQQVAASLARWRPALPLPTRLLPLPPAYSR